MSLLTGIFLLRMFLVSHLNIPCILSTRIPCTMLKHLGKIEARQR